MTQEELKQKIITLSQGNPGAAVFLTTAMRTDTIFSIVLVDELERMGLKGSALWVMYADICDHDLNKVGRLISTVPRAKVIEACLKQDRSGKQLIEEYLGGSL